MTTPAINTTTTGQTNSGTRTTADAQKGLNTNYQDFLKLLTTELNNQDPTSPMDPTAMVAQIASLSQVEQQINTNNILQQMVSMLSASQVNNAVGYIGKQVDATGNQVELKNGQGTLVYDLPAGTAKAQVTITNAAGQTVFTGSGPTEAGRNQVIWGGTNTTTGGAAADGTYSFTVTAKDASGGTLKATTFTSGTVTAVDTQGGTTSLSLGGISVPVTTVQSIYNPGTNPGI